MSDPIRERALRDYVELQLQAHDANLAGRSIDDIVKLMDGPWDAMTMAERELAGRLSAALYRARAGINR